VKPDGKAVVEEWWQAEVAVAEAVPVVEAVQEVAEAVE
jgi:hypothetical protein